MTPEAIAQKYATSRPGYELVSYGEVGLPYYRLTVKADVLEHKPIGPFAEFSLRTVAGGLTSQREIEGLLGLEEAVVETTLATLIEHDDLAIRRDPAGHTGVVLTKKGERTLSATTAIVPEEAVIELDYDGLLRRPVPFLDEWHSPVDLKARGVREIPPSPTRPPEIKDIDVAAVENLVRVVGDRREAKRDLLAFRSLERRRRFQLAVALVFRGEDPTDIQVAFVIDGLLSNEHEEAFARSRFKRKLIGGDSVVSAEAIAETVLGKALVKRARQADPRLREPVELPAITATGAEAEPVVDLPGPDLVRMIETYEHPAFLQEALTTASDRLLIVSPWVRRSIVNQAFISQLEQRLNQGVDVLIGWGITPLPERDVDIDAAVLKDFERLGEQFKFTFRYRRLGNTHAKILICDRRFLVVTSFNWLSFKGDPKRTFRDERGTLLGLPDKIDQQFADWSRRINGDGKVSRG